jgi:hypothetical protein
MPTEALETALNRFSVAMRDAVAPVTAYWLPSSQWVAFRSPLRRRPKVLPADAVVIGIFRPPCPRAAFAEALLETIKASK